MARANWLFGWGGGGGALASAFGQVSIMPGNLFGPRCHHRLEHSIFLAPQSQLLIGTKSVIALFCAGQRHMRNGQQRSRLVVLTGIGPKVKNKPLEIGAHRGFFFEVCVELSLQPNECVPIIFTPL